jgi:RNA polymerase sigma-70 factor (ECF subfamily)
MLEDKVLIWQFNHARPEALHQIYDKYKADLLTLATALLRDPAVAEDVVHDVFISFLETSGRFKLTGSLKGFLVTCVINAVRGIKRSSRRHPTTDLDQAGPIATDSDRPDRTVVLNEQLGRLRRALEQLPDLQLEALVLRVYGQMKFKDIAELQEVPTNTAVARYHYAMQKLRSLLDGEARK